MSLAGSASPSWSNEDADDFWDDDLGALDDEEISPVPQNTGSVQTDKRSNQPSKRAISAGSSGVLNGSGQKDDPLSTEKIVVQEDIASTPEVIPQDLSVSAQINGTEAVVSESIPNGVESLKISEKLDNSVDADIKGEIESSGADQNDVDQVEEISEESGEAEVEKGISDQDSGKRNEEVDDFVCDNVNEKVNDNVNDSVDDTTNNTINNTTNNTDASIEADPHNETVEQDFIEKVDKYLDEELDEDTTDEISERVDARAIENLDNGESVNPLDLVPEEDSKDLSQISQNGLELSTKQISTHSGESTTDSSPIQSNLANAPLPETEFSSDNVEDIEDSRSTTQVLGSAAIDNKSSDKQCLIEKVAKSPSPTVSLKENGVETIVESQDLVQAETKPENIANPERSTVTEPANKAQSDSPSQPDSQTEQSHLIDQIRALKLELDSKNARILQMEAKSAETTSADTDSPAQEKYVELEERLRQTEAERDHAQTQLEGFLSKISSMKTVFQNFKATQKELEEVRQELEEQKEAAEKIEHEKLDLQSKFAELEKQHGKSAEERLSKETETRKYLEVIENLRNEASDLNSECDRLSQLLGTLRREFQQKEETLQDEKYSLENEVSKLNKKLSEHKTQLSDVELEKEEAAIENKNLALALEESRERLTDKETELQKLQNAAQESNDLLQGKIHDLEDLIKRKDAEVADANVKITHLDAEVVQLKSDLKKSASSVDALEKEKEKIKSLEDDVHTKQLLIGKLRHEAIILNEHLTKSLSMLKQKSGDSDHTVDRELVSNMVLNFLQIPRGDTKKFEALSLIAGLLDWDDQKKIQAGLMHAGKPDDAKPRSGIISLWTDFLDKESTKK